MDVQIQSAAIADARALLDLQYVCYQTEAELYQDWSIPPLTQTLQSLEAELSSSVVLKAVISGRIIGSVRARSQRDTCEIGRLIVHPEYRRCGLGKRLTREIERAFPTAGRFELFTGERSERNIRLYASLGYIECRRQVVSPSLTLVYMERRRSQS